MVLIEFSLASRGGPEQSLSEHVARIVDIIDRSGVPYQLTSMGTILEGEWRDVMAVVTECFELLQAEYPRVGGSIKIDYRAGPAGRLTAKTDKIEQRLGRKLRT